MRARWKLLSALTILAVTAAVVAVALTMRGSASEGDPEPAAGNGEQALLDFAQCMRDNVPSFPDPVAKPDGTFGFDRPRGASPGALDQALKSCQAEARAAGVRIAPGQTQDSETQDAVLGFARCMRKNGVPEFPDPGPSGDFHELFNGIDFQSPRVQRAVQNCQSFLAQIFGHGG